METKVKQSKALAFDPKVSENIFGDLLLIDSETQIRIGVKMAEEAAKRETSRRRVAAPLTIEEALFSLSHY